MQGGVDAHLIQTPLIEAIAAPAHLLDQNLAKAPSRNDVEKEVEAVVEKVEDLGDHLGRLDVERRRSAAHAYDAHDQPEDEVGKVQYAERDGDDHEHPGDLVVLELILDDHIYIFVVGAVDLLRLTELLLLLLLLLLLSQSSCAKQLPNRENIYNANDENGKREQQIAVDDRQVEVDLLELVHDITFEKMVFLVDADVGHEKRVERQDERDDQDEQTDASGTARIAQHRRLQRKVDHDQTFECKCNDDPVGSEPQRVTKVS